VVPKPKQQKQLQKIFLGNQGFPDQSNEFDQLLYNVDGGPVLQKLRYPMANLDGLIYPRFHSPFIHEQHKDLMWKQIDLSHHDPNFQGQVYTLIRKYWLVFNEQKVFVPVKYYYCIIDTGMAQPIAVKKILYSAQ
jgi:hypothetical protein